MMAKMDQDQISLETISEENPKAKTTPLVKNSNLKGNSPPPLQKHGPNSIQTDDPTSPFCKPLIVHKGACPIICPALKKHRTAPTKMHRHSETIEQALNLVKAFAARTDKCDSQGMPESGLDCLEKQAWDYHGMTKGIRIYSKSGDAVFEEGVVGFQYAPMEEMYEHDETMPYIRGEGWLEGDWGVEDILATIRSFGARAIWDTRVDAANSKVVEVLNETDTLCHIRLMPLFPVGARDAVVDISDSTNCDATVGYWVMRSVIDPLVPPDPTIHRAHFHVLGWILRKLPYPPEYDFNQCILPMKLPKRPPPSESPPTVPSPVQSYFPSNPSSHRNTSSSGGSRTRSSSHSTSSGRVSLYGPPASSSVSRTSSSLGKPNTTKRSSLRDMGIIPRTPAYPRTYSMPAQSRTSALSALVSAPFIPSPSVSPSPERSMDLLKNRRTSSSSFSSVASSSSPNRRRSSSLAQSDNSSDSIDLPPRKPGIHVSLISRVSPGGPIPTSFRNAITLKSPLLIAELNTYLGKYGFAPYLQRKDRKSGLDVIEEDFKPLEGTYKVIYRCHPEVSGRSTRIRFYGGTFSHGKFSIEILRAMDWHVEYDNPPDVGHQLPTQPAIIPGDGFLDTKTSRMVFKDGPSRSSRSVMTPLEQPKKLSEDVVEGPTMPGPQGPCTLVIKNTVIGIPIQVMITKMPEKLKVSKPKRLSQAIGHASRIHAEHIRSASLEDLVKRGSISRHHSLGVESAKEVFRRLSMVPSSGRGTPNRESSTDSSLMYQTRGNTASGGSTGSNSTEDSSLFTLAANLGHSSDFNSTPASSIPTTPGSLFQRRSTGQNTFATPNDQGEKKGSLVLPRSTKHRSSDSSNGSSGVLL